MRVSVVIPTRNEALSIKQVLADLPANLVNEVIVVDSDSTDVRPRLRPEWEPVPCGSRDADTAKPA